MKVHIANKPYLTVGFTPTLCGHKKGFTVPLEQFILYPKNGTRCNKCLKILNTELTN